MITFDYPYTDMHELNLDWFLEKFKEYEAKIITQDGKIVTMEETVQQFTDFVTHYFDNLNVQQEINNKLDAMAASGELQAMLQPYFDHFVEMVDSQIMTQNERIDVLDARMSEFTHLTDGSTTGDAELADIRVGGNGITYSTAGDAVRGQYTELHAGEVGLGLLASSADLVDTSAISYTSGNVSTTSAIVSTYHHTDYIDIEGLKFIALMLPTFSIDGAQWGCAFYDTDQIYISGFGGENTGITASKKYVIPVPANAKYIRTSCRNTNMSDFYITSNIAAELDKLEASMKQTLPFIGMRGGYMQTNGDIYSPSTPNMIKKFKIVPGTQYLYLSGTSTMAVASPAYCSVWFVKSGAMMAGEYVDVASNPQTWVNYQLTVPDDAEEVWVYCKCDIALTTDYNYDINLDIADLKYAADNSETWIGAYTWTKRVNAIRMLADAQGCYFIPFNALGMGISRGNGIYGDSYYNDNIHPTSLAGYNLAYGIWSYLKNIPAWYTSTPGTTPPFDGTQWSGKSWYAYGTSLTQYSNSYVSKLASISGMTAVNKGVAGGALVTNRNLYNALLDMTDGKLGADLITIEVGANDSGNLGVPWSTDTNTFCGALNHCIKEMFAAGVQAQVVIMASYPSRYAVNDPDTKYDVDRLLNT